MLKIAVLGTGGWGIALALTAYDNGNSVILWTPFSDECQMLKEKREHENLLKGVKIPEEIEIVTDLNALNGSDMAIIAVPSFAVSETAKKLAETDIKIVINVAKGLEKGTSRRLSEVIEEALPERDIVVLSGPSHAEEVARKEPTSVVVSSKSSLAANKVQSALMCEYFRIYTGNDMVGVELGGAFKNIIAVAAGILDGLGYGDNPKAALITRGISEIARLGVALGARPETFSGLTGIGDLIVTCTSRHSRNHRFGELVGRGEDVETALKTVGTVEGYYATENAHELSKKVGVEMPITEAVYRTLFEKNSIEKTLKTLMTRPGKPEVETSWLTNIG